MFHFVYILLVAEGKWYSGNGFGGIKAVYCDTHSVLTSNTYRFHYPIVRISGTNNDGNWSLHAGCGNDNGVEGCHAICRSLGFSKISDSWDVSCGNGYPSKYAAIAQNCIYKRGSNRLDYGSTVDDWYDRSYGSTARCGNPMYYCDCCCSVIKLNEIKPPTISPTASPQIPSRIPSSQPSISPSETPTTTSPSNAPTFLPTSSPTIQPTSRKTSQSNAPSSLPTSSPTIQPTPGKTRQSNAPSSLPTSSPTIHPTSRTTYDPTMLPTLSPTISPTTTTSFSPTTDIQSETREKGVITLRLSFGLLEILVSVIVFLFVLILICLWRKNKKQKNWQKSTEGRTLQLSQIPTPGSL